MPGIVKVKVYEGRDLPVMDRASDLTDAFVEVRWGSATAKTDVFRKSLNPVWNSDWFKFEVDDEDLQEEVLQIKVLDYDAYSAHNSIGKVNIGLDVLVVRDGKNELSGWFPIYDTLHGIRGYVKVKVRVQFLVDSNKYRQTSCGVQFFSMPCIPQGYQVVSIQGFVDELLVNDDPEYQWIEKIRTPRASNEARQKLFTKLSGEMKRRIGLKVLEAGGNAVVGYQQQFDIEGDTGLVVRGIGTSVNMVKDNNFFGASVFPPAMQSFSPDPMLQDLQKEKLIQQLSEGNMMGSSTASIPIPRHLSQAYHIERTLSTSSMPENGMEKVVAESPDAARALVMCNRVLKTVEELEFPFFTLTIPPPGFVIHLGGMVSSRSVKLLDINEPDEPGIRDEWWREIRTEIRSHAKALGCQAVVGYHEYATICDDLIVLTAYGTAAVVHVDKVADTPDEDETPVFDEILHSRSSTGQSLFTQEGKRYQGTSLDNRDFGEFDPDDDEEQRPAQHERTVFNVLQPSASIPSCRICHVAYGDADNPLPVTLSKCLFCRRGKVPDLILSTIEPPEDIPITGCGCMIQSRIIRSKKKDKDETNAESISQILPFMEYELHRQLLNKLKLKGMNAVFGLQSELTVGDEAIVAIMTGTAVYLSALPPPAMLLLSSRKDTIANDDAALALVDIQKKMLETTISNRFFYNVKDPLDPSFRMSGFSNGGTSDNDCTFEEGLEESRLDLLSDVKEAYILEVDDKTDEGALPLLIDSAPHDGFFVFGTESSPGYPVFKYEMQYVNVYQRIKMPPAQNDRNRANEWLMRACDNLLMGMRLKMRSLMPCCLLKVRYKIDIDDDDYFQIALSAFCVGVDERICKLRQVVVQRSLSSHSDKASKNADDVPASSDMGFDSKRVDRTARNRQEGLVCSRSVPSTWNSAPSWNPLFQPPVVLSTMTYVPHFYVSAYYGFVSLFLIRESSNVKEEGGINLFMQRFIAEVHTIFRAHVQSLGGNAVLSFTINEIVLKFYPNKYQAQCLINVSGDAVEVRPISESFRPLSLVINQSTSSLDSAPAPGADPDVLEELKYKVNRAVYGTTV